MIFDLKDATNWDPIVNKALKNILGHTYHKCVRENAKKIKYCDSVLEACNLFSDIASKEKMVEAVTKEICRNFKEVLTYHACRPRRIDDYYEKGITPLSPTDAQKQFRDFFNAYASQEDINKAISAVSINTRAGVVHTVLDDRTFIYTCGHYLIYGSEYQQCLAVHLYGASEQTRDILKKEGKATIFVCRLPFRTINNLEFLVPRIMADHFYRVAHNYNKVNIIDYTITLRVNIPPKAIVNHVCPIRIKDPFKQQAFWNDETMQYE